MKDLSKLNLKEKKVIIFDLDGTLIDSIGVWNMTDHKMIHDYAGLDIDEDYIQIDRDKFFHENLGSDNIYLDYCSYLINKYGLSITDANELSIIRGNISNAILGKEIGFKDSVVKLIFKLKELGYTLALATVSSAKQLEVYYKDNQKMLKEMNILDVFDLITKKEDVKNKKPDPEIYLKIMNYYGVSPQECLVFEDSYTGVLAANSAGIEVVNIYDKYADLDRDKINAITDYSINNYEIFTSYLDADSHIHSGIIKKPGMDRTLDKYIGPSDQDDGVKRMKKVIKAAPVINPYDYIAR